MLIVLEGCDGSGKTTLATFLSKLLNAEIVHCSTHTPNTFCFFRDIIEASKERNIIADRFCYGQFVYQEEEVRPLREPQYASTAEVNLHALEMYMLEAGAKVVLVTADPTTIRNRLSERGEELINGLTIEQVLWKFQEVRFRSLLTWIEYNTGGETDD